jgi:hypothetical protein
MIMDKLPEPEAVATLVGQQSWVASSAAKRAPAIIVTAGALLAAADDSFGARWCTFSSPGTPGPDRRSVSRGARFLRRLPRDGTA